MTGKALHYAITLRINTKALCEKLGFLQSVSRAEGMDGGSMVKMNSVLKGAEKEKPSFGFETILHTKKEV